MGLVIILIVIIYLMIAYLYKLYHDDQKEQDLRILELEKRLEDYRREK